MKLLTLALVLLAVGGMRSFSSYGQVIHNSEEVVYVETTDTAKINAFIHEMESYSNKIVDVDFDYATHQFSIIHTDLMKEETIYQILRQYFIQYKTISSGIALEK